MQYSFEGFVLDTEKAQLYKQNTIIKLRPKAYKLLLLLLERRHRVVEKHEILDHIWPNRIIAEATLWSTVECLYEPLLDKKGEQRLIKTNQGGSFRFVAPTVLKMPIKEGVPGATPVERPDAPHEQSSHAEKRRVSVLSCKLGGLNSLGSRASQDRIETLVNQATHIVKSYGGTIIQWQGKGCVALFGAPIICDDPSYKCLQAAQKLQDSMLFEEISLKLAIHSGHLALDEMHLGPHHLCKVLAEMLGTNADLLKSASTRSILVSKTMQNQLACKATLEQMDFELVDHPYLQAYEIKTRTQLPQPKDTRTSMDLIGRSGELEILQQAYAKARQGTPQILGVIADSGMGKSRLLYEFLTCAEIKSAIRITNACAPYAQRPLTLVRNVLLALCELQRTPSHMTPILVLKRLLLENDISNQDTCTLLFNLLSNQDTRQVNEQLSPRVQLEYLFNALAKLVRKQSEAKPLIIAIEDVHWLDVSSETFLLRLVNSFDKLPVLVVYTQRPGYEPAWLKHHSAKQLILRGLSETEAMNLIASICTDKQLTDSQIQYVLRTTQGNAFFIIELTRALLTHNRHDSNSQAPDSAEAVIAARISQLQISSKYVLQTAAVIGPHFDIQILQAVLPEGLQEHFEQRLVDLQNNGFIDGGNRARSNHYRFRHVLVREVSYRSLSNDERQKIHQKVATHITSHSNINMQQSEILAYHYTGAGRFDIAIQHWLKAARAARRRCALREAIDFIARGMSLLHRFSETQRREIYELELQAALAPLLMTAKGYASQAVKDACQRVRELSTNLNDRHHLARAMTGLWNHHWMSGNFIQAIEAAQRLLALAEQHDDPMMRLRAHASLGETYFHMGKFEQALLHLKSATLETNQKTLEAGRTPRVSALCYLAWSELYLDNPRPATTAARHALEYAYDIDQSFSLCIALCLNAGFYVLQGNPEDALPLAKDAARLAKKQGFQFWEGSARVYLGWALSMTGNHEKGIPVLQSGIQLYLTTGAKIHLSCWYGLLAEALDHCNQKDQAAEALEQAYKWADQNEEQYFLPRLLNLAGKLETKPQEVESTANSWFVDSSN